MDLVKGSNDIQLREPTCNRYVLHGLLDQGKRVTVFDRQCIQALIINAKSSSLFWFVDKKDKGYNGRPTTTDELLVEEFGMDLS